MSNIDPMNYQRYFGWPQTVATLGGTYQYLFKPETINKISKRITKLLKNVDPLGRNIIYPNARIKEILASVYSDYSRPNIGAIYTKDVIPNSEFRDDSSFVINQTISIIVTTLKNEIGMEEANKKLSIWDSVLGDFNEKGLRGHDVLKIKKNRPQPMMFNMNY